MGPAQHCCPRLSLARHACVHSDLPHSTSPRADSPRSLLQLSLSSNELSFLQSTAFAAAAGRLPKVSYRRRRSTVAGRHRRSPPPVAGPRHRLPDAAAGCRTPPPVAAAGRLMQSTASAVAAGRQLLLSADVSRSGQPLVPPLVSRTVDSPCCHCLLVLVLMDSFRCLLGLMNSLRCFLER
jgi:hypothetical protein